MKNQYSFRLATTVLPTDIGSQHTAKTTQVINKVDSDGNKFYPTFNEEETVVITNDDRTVMETVKATCNNWTLTFSKRWLSDDASETSIDNRKLTWNPWSLCFVTAWAWDYIDPDEDRVWTGKQTYTNEAEYRDKATYKWRLITEKWVEYPHFDSLEELQAYTWAFGWMFAVVDSDWELYRYNAVDEEWSVVTTSTPVQPSQASTSAIGTVRVATDAEFTAGTDQGSNNEFLMAKISKIKSMVKEPELKYLEIWTSATATGSGASLTYNFPHSWWAHIWWSDKYEGSTQVVYLSRSSGENFWRAQNIDLWALTDGLSWVTSVPMKWYYPVKKWENTISLAYWATSSIQTKINLFWLYYYE